MNFEQYNAERIFVVGPSIRTSILTAARDIPAFWQKFFSEDLARLERRAGEDGVYAVYCDYESDWRGEYTMVIGVAADREKANAGYRTIEVPSGRYARVAVAGDANQVWQAWSHINQEWEGRHERRYAADFERYDASSLGTGHLRADIVVGLK